MKKIIIITLLVLSGLSPLGAQELVRYVWMPSWDINIPGTSSNFGDMPLSAMRWNVGTHYSTFAVGMNSAGTTISWGNLLADRRTQVNAAAHAAGKPIYLCLGGWGSDAWMTSAFNSTNRATTIATLIATLDAYKYDGFDFDWEPFGKSDTAIFYPFVRQLHAALAAKHAWFDASKKPEIILTMSPGGSQWGAALKPMEPYLKYVVLMAYDKMGTWTVVSYYDCAVTARDATGVVRQTVGGQEPATMERQAAQTAGFDPKKIIVGFDAMAASMSGVTAPLQTIPSGASINADVKFDTFYKDVLTASPVPVVRYDTLAGAYWFTKNGNFYTFMGAPGYDRAIGKAFSFFKSKGYGGVAAWDWTEAYLGTAKFPTASYPTLDRDWVGTQMIKYAGGTTPPPPPPTDTDGDGVPDASDNCPTVAGPASNNGCPIVTPPPPGDVTVPVVSMTAPATGSTVSGTIQVNVNATDASGISTVKFKVDGAFTGAADASSPYSFSWNSASVANGSHTLGAEATDGAGLKATGGVQIVVNNPVVPPPPPPPAGGTVNIYDDQLVSPWMNVSWGAVNTFNSTDRVLEGTYSIKSVQNAWGSISVHNGSWTTPVNLNTSGFDSLRFAVYPEGTGLTLAVWFGNDIGGTFPKVTTSSLPSYTWTVISIPVAALNAGGQVVHQLNIQNFTSGRRTYHVDEVELTLKAGGMASSTTLSGIETESVVPERFSLSQNYPNPFNPTTTIRFGLPEASQVTVRVYDVSGREVRRVFEGELGAGFGSVQWDGRNDAGATLATGVYFYRIEAVAIQGAGETFVETRRMLLMK